MEFFSTQLSKRRLAMLPKDGPGDDEAVDTVFRSLPPQEAARSTKTPRFLERPTGSEQRCKQDLLSELRSKGAPSLRPCAPCAPRDFDVAESDSIFYQGCSKGADAMIPKLEKMSRSEQLYIRRAIRELGISLAPDLLDALVQDAYEQQAPPPINTEEACEQVALLVYK